MSWGDMNGDGKTNYIDYKIYETEVASNSGGGGGGGCGGIIGGILILGFFAVMIALMGQELLIIGLWLGAVLLVAYLIGQRKLRKQEQEKEKEDEEAEKIRTQTYEREEKTKGTWRCDKCGAINNHYLTRCSCGRSKLDIK